MLRVIIDKTILEVTTLYKYQTFHIVLPDKIPDETSRYSYKYKIRK